MRISLLLLAVALSVSRAAFADSDCVDLKRGGFIAGCSASSASNYGVLGVSPSNNKILALQDVRRTLHWQAGGIITGGSTCSATLGDVQNGVSHDLVYCDAADGTMEGSIDLRDGFVASATVDFSAVVYSKNASPSGTATVQIACQCRAKNAALGSFGTATSVSVTLGDGVQYSSNQSSFVTVTCAGTSCDPGDTLAWKATVTSNPQASDTGWKFIVMRYASKARGDAP